ncbi:MAG: pyruvate dehydrogenase (acetyl-transferring), homodimeric type [Caldilineaceae bacterium]
MQTQTSPLEQMALDKQEWLESIAYIQQEYGPDGVREILRSLQNYVLGAGITLNEATLNTPYRNTIHVSEQPIYPGDLALEQRVEAIIRWNAMAMVIQAADSGSGVGGHIATYASAATLMEVGFNHFFRNRSADYGGDLIFFQPHASPGFYARAFLEGRLSETQLKNFRRELQPGGGLSSYPHPHHMSDFWQAPSASMGLSTPSAIYQARFAKYLENRGLKPANGGKVWCFIGDGETDEPEVLGTISTAAREGLDNLILVVNCNLQRLDGPVRGNGKIIQELERAFRGADWNVLKVVWGGGWDGLLARDQTGALQRRMDTAVDGEYQYYSTSSGDVQRERWVENNPELERLMNSLTDEEVQSIQRGGQDPKKIYAAYRRALETTGKPTVILIKTVKGDGMGHAGQGRNTAHQMKQLSAEERLEVARRYQIPLDTEAITRAEFYRPPEDGPELRYLHEQRTRLGGYLPERKVNCPTLPAPPLENLAEFLQGSGTRELSTTAASVRLLARLLKDEKIGRYVVPIVPDEARTFGLEGLFKDAGIYSAVGQNYTPVDGQSLLPYREATDGQILQEGICEVGAMASFLAAGTAYAVHGIPTIPFYFFYSIFGFQRVGDMIWSCGDMLCRGFLMGGTAGRTTLNGEGLQHQDGHSQVVAQTVPNLKSYDPAFAYELAVIVRDGIRRMYEEQEHIFYYLTVYNETYPMAAMPDTPDIEEGILQGMYCYRRAKITAKSQHKAHIFGSGPILLESLRAQELLAELDVAADVWSVTSYNELFREAEEAERWNRLHPAAPRRIPYVAGLLAGEDGVFVAASDYIKALANRIARWVPGPYQVLGTDGFGLSESRPALRDYFEVSAEHIAVTALYELVEQGSLATSVLEDAIARYGIDPDKPSAAQK